MNPSVPQSYIDRHVADDPARAQAEYFAQLRTDVEGFIAREVIEAAVITGRYELPRIEDVRYIAFVDPSGGSGDSMTLAICHIENVAGTNHAVLDLIREVRPPFNPDAVTAEFAAIIKSYGLTTVQGDRYAGRWPRDRFAAHGINYEVSTKSASEIYVELLPILNSGRVELLDHPRLATQLVQLERHVGSARDTIKHPPGSHDDVANAVVYSLAHAAQDVTSFPTPIVAGAARNIPGNSEFTGVGVPLDSGMPASGYDYNVQQDWKSYVNSDGSIRIRPFGGFPE